MAHPNRFDEKTARRWLAALKSGGPIAAAVAAVVGAGLGGAALKELFDDYTASRHSDDFAAALKEGAALLWVRCEDPDSELAATRASWAERLGRVEVRLTVDDSGRAQAALTVEKPQTLDLLQKDAPQLQRALKDAGLDLSQSGLNFSLKGQQQQSGNGGNAQAQSAAVGYGSTVNATTITIQSVDPSDPNTMYLTIDPQSVSQGSDGDGGIVTGG